MARTRNASNVLHADDGELLDKEGKPIPTDRATWTGVSQQPNPDAAPVADPEPPAPEVPIRYRCNETTVQRNMDARDLFVLLGMILGDKLALDLDADEYGGLSADLRQHFRRVM